MTENGNGYRTYDSGASRDTGIGKLEFSRCWHPIVLKRFAEFMFSKCIMPDGSYRRSDNWQKGIPTDDLIESLERHDSDIQLHLKGWGEEATETLQTACCAALFNIQAILLKELERQREINPRILNSNKAESGEAIHRGRIVSNGSVPTNGSPTEHDLGMVAGRRVGAIHPGGPDGSGLHGPEGIRDRAPREPDTEGEVVYVQDTELIPQPESET